LTFAVLVIVSVTQLVFAALLAAFLFMHRAGAERRKRDGARGLDAVAVPLRAWLVGQGSASAVCDALDRLPPDAARSTALRIGRDKLDADANAELSLALRARPWVHDGFALASSRWWWKRLEAARFIADLGTAADERAVRRLLHDPHAAVRAAATSCLRRIANPSLIEVVLNELPRQPLVVRSTQLSLLRAQWPLAREALLPRLTLNAPAAALPHWIGVAEALETPDVLAQVVRLHAHPSVQVRISVARALKKYFHPDSARALTALLADADWRVRAQAARSFGVLHDLGAVPLLERRVGDAAWWVRFRSALALSQLGDSGRATLRAVRAGPDEYASQMAAMVSGLSQGSALELVEG
jgi:hypothetical protein